ncbi:hypothetical protein [Bifidobacterium sp.]|jgi:hypothetical protein|uniref:hypothetical protein n=1 Tax=Bifidobacterium sp. TaxID=41200 RepID=UPI0025B854FE|nr:hypothetical protein [Bifidobacterium sp.]MCI1636018.1 hypothetical protein [Bifidobacterium sp.]
MTDHNNSNPSEQQPNQKPDGDSSPDQTSHTQGSGSDAWSEFLDAHADDISSVERSRDAKRFEKSAKKAQKKAALSVNDLKDSAFTASGHPSGPRDFEGRSWLDTDAVMDSGNSFTPPNPDLGKLRSGVLVFSIMCILALISFAAAILLPSWSGTIGTVGGILMLIGGVGLFTQLRGHTQTRNDPFDDGSRV